MINLNKTFLISNSRVTSCLSNTLNAFLLRANNFNWQRSTCYSTEESAQSDEGEIKPKRVFWNEVTYDRDGFRIFDPYMKKRPSPPKKKQEKKYSRVETDKEARCNSMPIEQDWTSVWPTRSMFKQSVVPLPLRQGFVKNMAENEGLPPSKYANTELIKIPNFFHLTPNHIKKQYKSKTFIKKEFCTEWPKELATKEDCNEHFPLNIVTSNYIYDGPSIRDERARVVTLSIKVSALGLDERAEQKLKHLAGHRYNNRTKTLTIVADRCPFRKQNEDYAMYLLTTLYFESMKCDKWEKEITEEDWLKFSPEVHIEEEESYRTSISKLKYKESYKNLAQYKESVLSLLKIKKASSDTSVKNSEQAKITQPETTEASTKQPETTEASTKQPETTEASTKQPETMTPSTTQS